MIKPVFFLSCVFLALYTNLSYSQVSIDSSEITASVPELFAFHEIIYPIWHTAYPAKDIKALKGFVPQIRTHMEAINKAVLPGILKDKDAAWKNQLRELNRAAEDYYKASEGEDDDTMLAAAENLHASFEKSVRVIRPVMKEMDEYHQTLYIIYHKLYPSGKYDEIAGMMDRLVLKADAIVKFPQDRLKRRLGDRISRYEVASKDLYSATVALQEALGGTDAAKKDQAVEHMHTEYRNLESVFE